MQKLSQFFDVILQPRVFTVFYILWLSINMVAVINPLSFTRYFLALFAVWAVAVAVKQYFFHGLSPYKDKLMPLLLVFLAFCFLAELIQFRYTGVKMLVQLCFFAIAILLLYAQYRSDSAQYKQTLLAVSKGLGIWIALTMFASLIMFIALYSGTLTLRTGTQLHFGFYENRLVGVFTSPNVGGMFALILIWASLLTWELHTKSAGKVFWRVLCGIQILLACTYISLALSRGTYVAVYIFLICYLLLHTPLKKEQALSRGKQIVVRLVATVVICAIFAGGCSLLHKTSCALMELSYKIQLKENPDSEEAMSKAELLQSAQLGFDGRTEANREDIDVSNKRFDIWETHTSFLHGRELLFGIGHPVQYYEKTLADGGSFTEHQKAFVEWASGNMHNGYLQILVNCGIFPFLMMLVFLAVCVVLCILHVVKLTNGKRNPLTDANRVFTLCIPMVVAILANNMMETNFVLMGANLFQAVFWFAAGACVQAVGEAKQTENGATEK